MDPAGGPPENQPSPEEDWFLLIEYEKLKDEQAARIGFRDNLIYASIATVGAAVAFTASNGESASILLAVPLVTFALGWTYLANDIKITEIGRYLSKQTAPGSTEPAFRWETHHRAAHDRTRRKIFQLIVDIGIFPAVGTIAAIYGWNELGQGVLPSIAAAAGTLLSLVLAVEIVRTNPATGGDRYS